MTTVLNRTCACGQLLTARQITRGWDECMACWRQQPPPPPPRRCWYCGIHLYGRHFTCNPALVYCNTCTGMGWAQWHMTRVRAGLLPRGFVPRDQRRPAGAA